MVLELFADSSKLLEKLADVNQNFLKYVPIVFKQRHFMKLNFFFNAQFKEVLTGIILMRLMQLMSAN